MIQPRLPISGVDTNEVWLVLRRPSQRQSHPHILKRCDRCGCVLARDNHHTLCSPCGYTTHRQERAE